MKYFKVRLKRKGSSLETFILVKARSVGEAVVLADNTSYGTRFEICDNPAAEISQAEFLAMAEEPPPL